MDKQDLSTGDDQSEDGQLRSPYELKDEEDDHRYVYITLKKFLHIFEVYSFHF